MAKMLDNFKLCIVYDILKKLKYQILINVLAKKLSLKSQDFVDTNLSFLIYRMG